MVELAELLHRAQWGRLTADELEYVAGLLKSDQHVSKYTLLHILGRGDSSKKYRELVAEYLYCPGDPMLSALALKVLCQWWHKTMDYRDELIVFLRGVDWDVGEYVRLEALSVAGEFLRKKTVTPSELLKRLQDSSGGTRGHHVQESSGRHRVVFLAFRQ